MSELPTQSTMFEALVDVQIDVRDEDAVTRCFTDDWQAAFYPMPDRQAVLQHWAYNAIVNGVKDASRLEGWADLEAGTVTMSLESVESLR